VTFGDLDARHFENGSAPFQFVVDSSTPCLAPAQLALDISADGGYAVTRTLDFVLESDVSFVAQEFFENVEAGVSASFSHTAESGTDDWAIVSTDAYSPTHSWFTSDGGAVKDASLVSPPLFVSAGSVLTFRHRYVLESNYDGAVLEISTDDGDTWTDIGQSYNGSLDPRGPAFGSPFAPGKAFWTGNSNGFVLQTVNLGAMNSALGQPLYAGKTVRIRWRIGTDNANSIAPFIGWWVDDIRLTSSGTFSTVCDATPACSVVGVPGPGPAVARTQFESGRPNPMSTSSVFRYQVAPEDAGPIVLRVFDISGRTVKSLVETTQPSGQYQITWDRSDDGGIKVRSGLYLVELRAGAKRIARKMTLVE
jgi:hypothetical protein